MQTPVLLKILSTFLPLAITSNLAIPQSAIAQPTSIVATPKQSDADAALAAGMRHSQANQLHNAFEQFQQAHRLYRQQLNTEGEVLALTELIRISIDWRDYESAIQYNKQLLILNQGKMNQQGTANALETFAQIYQAWPRYQSAISYYGLTLGARRKLRDRPGEANALSQLGSIHQTIGNLQKALNYHQQSITIRSELNDSLGQRQSLQSLGNVYQALGDAQNAIAHYEKSLTIAEKLGDRSGYGKTLGDLGRFYELLNPKQAIDYQEKSLAIARQLKDKIAEAEALSNLGNAHYAMGDWTKAIDYQRKSFDLYWTLDHELGQGMAAHHLGRAYFQANDLNNAEKYLREAMWQWQEVRTGLSDANTIAIAETQASTYKLLQTVLVNQNNPEYALFVAESARGRAFAELLNYRSQVSPGENALPSDYGSAFMPNLNIIRYTAHKQNVTLVTYSMIDDKHLYIWVVQPSGDIVFEPVDLTQSKPSIEHLVKTSRRSIGVRSALKNQPQLKSLDPNQHLRQLHQILIEPIAAHLPTDPNQRVVFIPQGALFMVPFPALRDPQGKYLIEKHTISTAPSIQTLTYTRDIRDRQIERHQNPQSHPLIVGNPAFKTIEDLELLPLPHAEQEAKTIAELLGTKALVGIQATKSTVLDRISQASTIHFATHGLLDESNGEIPGAILFTPSDKDDGLLNSKEILNLQLNADLVVLSACDTGRGKISGDGVLGLSRSIIAAGAPSVIVSLWAVDDSSTAQLMSEFYRNRQAQMNKAQALRQAMLITLKNHPDPREWAAFTLIGEAE